MTLRWVVFRIISSERSEHEGKKVRGIGKTFDTMGESVYAELEVLKQRPISKEKIDSKHSVYFDVLGRVNDTPVYLLDNLGTGDVIEGPGVVIDATQTILLTPSSKAVLTSNILYITIE